MDQALRPVSLRFLENFKRLIESMDEEEYEVFRDDIKIIYDRIDFMGVVGLTQRQIPNDD